MDEWVHYYERVMGFSQLVHFDDKDISTEYSALMSKVVQEAGGGSSSRSTNRPRAAGVRRSRNTWISMVVRACSTSLWRPRTSCTPSGHSHNDVSFLRVPKSYYDMLPDRVGKIDENIRDLAELGILVDRDEEGYLLQIFTKPVRIGRRVFFEVIERHGSRSFGKGNFKALFEAIEREQATRGTL